VTYSDPLTFADDPFDNDLDDLLDLPGVMEAALAYGHELEAAEVEHFERRCSQWVGPDYVEERARQEFNKYLRFKPDDDMLDMLHEVAGQLYELAGERQHVATGAVARGLLQFHPELVRVWRERKVLTEDEWAALLERRYGDIEHVSLTRLLTWTDGYIAGSRTREEQCE
jgi:hypothetical protein